MLIKYTLLFLMCPWKVSLEEERSFLDKLLLPFLREFRSQFLNFQLNSNINRMKILKQNNRLQEIIPDSIPFPCQLNGTRSDTRPENVHNLRPGDIDVVGALGDSLTAGFGLAAIDIPSVGIEDRGKSFSIGGEGTWRNYRTLPNILKVFNPNLIGYSLGPSLTIQKASQFNVAEGGAVSNEMPFMTKVLIKRIKSDKRVNVEKDWKMITILIGDNDFCLDLCYYKNPEEAVEKHKNEMLQVMRLLRDNLPRTIVNIIPAANVEVLSSAVGKPLICHFVHKNTCPCIFSLPYANQRKYFFNLIKRWQDVDIEIATLPEFDLDNFAVVAQPFSTDINFKQFKDGTTDFSYLSTDCFHLSQKFNALVANNLWNNIMQPVGRKSRFSYNFNQINCPTNENPYIYTKRNSFK